MAIQDRIVELRRVPPADLHPHPKNWRRHPKAQQDALRAMLDRVGFVGAVIARETPDGLMLIDGHLRADLTPDAEIPVLVDKNVGMETGGHSTQKPLECMERPIRNDEGDVYDPFVGSGTTIIAAERQGRACYAMEVESRYVDMAIERWEQYTGGKAVCIGEFAWRRRNGPIFR